MLDDTPTTDAGSTSGEAQGEAGAAGAGENTPPAVVTKTTRTRTTRKVTTPPPAEVSAPAPVSAEPLPEAGAAGAAVKKTTTTRTTTKKAAAKRAAAKKTTGAPPDESAAQSGDATATPEAARDEVAGDEVAGDAAAAPAETTPGKKTPAKKTPGKKTAAKKSAAKKAPAKKAAAKKSAATKTTKETAAAAEPPAEEETASTSTEAASSDAGQAPLFQAPAKPTRSHKAAAVADGDSAAEADATSESGTAAKSTKPKQKAASKKAVSSADDQDSLETSGAQSDEAPAKKKSTAKKKTAKKSADSDQDSTDLAESNAADSTDDSDPDAADPDAADPEAADPEATDDESGSPARRRRRRGGRRRRRGGSGEADDTQSDSESDDSEESESDSDDSDETEATSSRRRRRRRRAGEEGADDGGDDPNTVTRVRKARSPEDQITALSGSTRLEAKKQRRREGREAGRRRAPIVSEAEFLARREAVDRVMVIRQRKELTQIAVIEDKVLVEHYVARESQTSLIGNVYLGRVQNVLPSMEAAFIDIGKGRNAVLYAGEVNWQALGHKDGQPRKIESVLSSGQSVLVQVTKDPVGHKGARLTSQISLAGRFLVYVPDGTTSGISRKLPDTERSRLKSVLKEIVPESAGVIVRTAAEGAAEDELTRDVERLKARWEDVESKSKGSAPQLLYGEPDLTLKVVRDLFTEDFTRLIIEGDDAWETVHSYVEHVAPDLADRLEKYDGADGKDVFATWRIDEQIHKGLDRKVWLPSGGSLVIDRTEAMTVVDVNTGKFTGSGGNLEETVTKNNLEAAEEIVRQLRLRDIGGIIVVDFIDMVLESNRDLVLRRLVECLGRDRTRHQVAEVTSLGLVQMTRKRIGTGLLEAFSEICEHCQGRGLVLTSEPVEPGRSGNGSAASGSGQSDSGNGGGESRRSRRGRGRGRQNDSDADSANGSTSGSPNAAANGGGSARTPSPADVAAMPRTEEAKAAAAISSDTDAGGDEVSVPEATSTVVEADAPDAPTPADDAGAEPDKAAPEQLLDVAATEAEDAQPAKPAVSRTRRRSATRPAGPPVAPAAVPPAGGTGAVGQPAHGQVEPGTADVEPATSGSADGAGPAAAGVSGEAAAAAAIEHVPVKKKGARKR